MSRFKLFALFAAMMAQVSVNPRLNNDEKVKERKAINRRSGGLLFMANPYGPRPKNQRQKRKKWRQNPHSKKTA